MTESAPRAPGIEITQADVGEDLREARSLILEYAASLGFDLGFQQFDEEIASLPGEYASPSGCLLLARLEGKAAGCVGVRAFAERICEMKRMYVRPTLQHRGVGRALAQGALHEARAMGYRVMRLDTLASMEAARALYRSLGFREIEAYRHNPLPDAVYMECDL
ncbi:MAG: GNAT family N-acetyltransferase [Candidatus Eisenbacteria bacterium]|jgi:ribosomal protein S18 acetylase RimI-like enzyme|nr:GNAT family N-acetyltransferase [Candidatus Eisenbacteria bacterium]